MKYVMGLLVSASALFGLGECDTCAKVPLAVSVNFSKKGMVYETDFQAPWNMWGSLVEFYIGIRTPDARFASNEENKMSDYILNGHPQKTTPYFKVKITLTPLGWASDDITVISNLNKGWLNRKEKHYYQDQKIEEIISIPLYGGDLGTGKTFVIADLQRLRNYHVRVESLEDVELPKGVSTSFIINRFSTKH